MLNSIILLLMVITQVLGDIFLSKAMKIYGEISNFSSSMIIEIINYLFHSPWFYLSLINLTISWFLYLFCVSKMDLSYVLPIHSSSYILNALLASLLLQEIVTPPRWYATALISIGVFIVGYGKYQQEKRAKRRSQSKNLNPILLVLTTSIYLPVIWLVIIAMVIADSAGDILNAQGMRQITPPRSVFGSSLLKWSQTIFTNVNVLLGTACQILALLLFILLLSWGDVSFIRPASAISYILTLSFAKYILHEQINTKRLMGIVFIFFGAIILSTSY